ncbi:hypothetical protein K388_00308 [Streptomyces sp. KhCrAH-43]|uniref:hypothetical protein n=1 Tax=Streptomyces sp. SID4920 TaxID=2690271 RepID=UPI0003632D9C|nr:hypothetical protein [Streptomyces sp. SID4920]MYS37898.1 hypothetical protein [Streptomyces sp. SID4920]RAJ67568.1 hypothetical protein K388_00308 [Streptomyces sp. KhCrAH-43]
MDCTKPAKTQCDVTCGHCGADVEQTEGRGRRKLFCSAEHGRSYRRRMRALGFPV